MNRLRFAVSLAALLCALNVSAQPGDVDAELPPQDADSDFTADIQYLEPVQVRAWGKELTLRVSVSRWGALDRQTEFTVDLLSTPAFVIDASFDDGAQLSFEPEKMDADLTLTLTLGEESDSAAGELTLRVTSTDAELQPQQRLLVIPFEFQGYGDARVELCLRQFGDEHPPQNCPAEGNYYRDDQVWIRYAPSVDMSEPFEWQVVAQGGRVVRRGVHDPDLGMPAYDRPTTVYEKPLNDLKDIRDAGRVAIPMRLNWAGRYEVQLRAAIAKIPDLLFGSVPVAGYEFDGDWRPEGDFEVTDAKLSFKAFVTQPRVTSPGGGGAGIVLQSIKTSFGEPELHLTLPAEWERPDCNRPPERDQPQAMLRQSITSQIDLSFPAEMDILVPYDPDAGSSGSMPSMGSFSDALNRGSDAIRDRINPGTWYSVAGTLGLAGTGQVPVGRCDELYAVQTSLRFGDMHVTNQSLADYSGSLSGGGLNILYNNSTPTPGLERIDTQKGHDYVRGNAGGFDLQMRPIILGGEFGSPQRTLGDHIRNGDTRFIIPVAMQLSMWGKPGPAQRHLGKPLMGFAVYGLTEKPYDGGSPPGAGDAIAFADSAAAQIPADSNSSMARGGDALADALVAAGSSGTGGTGAQAGGATTSGVKPQVFIDDFRSAPRTVAPATTPVTAPASAVETTDIADAQAQREAREREQDEAARRERADAIASRSDGWSDRIQSVDDNSAAQDARDAAQQATAAQAAANAPPVVFTDDANDFDATMDDLRDEQEQLEDEAEAILTGNTPGTGSANAGSMTDDEVIGTVLTGGDTTDFDTRSVDCNEQTVAGGNKPASISINVDRAGSAQFTFQTYGAEDHMWVVSGGQTVFDSTCIGTNGNRTATVQLSPFGETKVVVKPNCLDDDNTAWNFTMSCPQ